MATQAIEFLNWTNNNFFTPVGTDGNFGLETEHPEFYLTIDHLNPKGIFTTEQLFDLFIKGEGVH